MAMSTALVPKFSSLSRVYASPSVILWFVLSVEIHTYTNRQLDISHIKQGTHYLQY